VLAEEGFREVRSHHDAILLSLYSLSLWPRLLERTTTVEGGRLSSPGRRYGPQATPSLRCSTTMSRRVEAFKRSARSWKSLGVSAPT
jgi:hypothetical protein